MIKYFLIGFFTMLFPIVFITILGQMIIDLRRYRRQVEARRRAVSPRRDPTPKDGTSPPVRASHRFWTTPDAYTTEAPRV